MPLNEQVGPTNSDPSESGVRPREVLAIAAALIALETLVFWGYFSGASIPPWDFVNQIDVFAWWNDGSFFHPVEWLPYAWGGYPGVLDIQNSSWYLPVGLASLFGPITLHAAAIVLALHVAFGSFGMYVWARSWHLSRSAAYFGMVSWFFVSGFYANAESLDIIHGYSWVSWLFWLTSINFPWRRWWGPLVAGFIVWQSLLGLYQGMIIAGLYVLMVWVIAQQFVYRPKVSRFLGPIIAAAVLGATASLLRYLPFLLIRGGQTPSAGDGSRMAWDSLGTLFFPFLNSSLPNDVTMRSFFLPSVVFVLIGFVPLHQRLSRLLLLVTGFVVVVSFPIWFWHRWLMHILPGANLSRFVLSDYKVFLLAALCILSVLGADEFLSISAAGKKREKPDFTRYAPWLNKWSMWVALIVIALTFMVFGHFDFNESLGQFLVLTLAIVTVGTLSRAVSIDTRGPLFTICIFALVSGLLSVVFSTSTWDIPREATEKTLIGDSISNLLQSRTAQSAMIRRPARVPTPVAPLPGEWALDKWGRAFYTGDLTVFAYVNLKGDPTFERTQKSLYDPQTLDSARAFWAAPGLVIASTPDLPDQQSVQTCAETFACGSGLVSRPVRYSSGKLVYQLQAPRSTRVMLNEAYHRGWVVQLCNVQRPTTCMLRDAVPGTIGQVVFSIPEGRWIAEIHYRTPGMRLAWSCFWTATMGLLLWSLSLVLSRRRRASRLNGASVEH